MKFIDMHCDTISEIYSRRKNGEKTELKGNGLQLDLKRMKEAGYLMQVFAMYVNLGTAEIPLQSCMDLIDLFYKEMEENIDWIEPVTTYAQIQNNQRAGKMSALLSIEEGACCHGDLSILRNFYRLGVRMMTLTWNYSNELAWPNKGMIHPVSPFCGKPEMEYGLTETGLEVITEMERLGMIIDVSHLSDAGFYQVCEATAKPFIASHSNAREICPHVRNLTDDMIRILAERGGVMGINFSENFTEKLDENTGRGTIDGLIRHMKHIVNVGGIQCIGLGSDFDGIQRVIEMDDCSMMPYLADAMKKAGFSESDIEAICYKNVMRLIQEVL